MANGEYLVAPTYVWGQGREALDRLQYCHTPCLGIATLRDWIQACLEAEEMEEEEMEEEEMEEEEMVAEEM